MQNKELHYIIQVQKGFRYVKEHGYIPNWKDLEIYPCGLHQKNKCKAEKKAKEKLREYNCILNHKAYRIIKRYIDIEDFQLKLSFPHP